MNKNNDSAVEQGAEIVKKKGKPRGGNNFLTDAALNVEEGDNAKYIHLGMEVMNLPSIDLHDAEAVSHRLGEYFEIYARYDTKPTVAGMAMALGISRQMLWAIKANQPVGGSGSLPTLPRESADLIKKAYAFMEQLWENYMQNGKINPVSGIFIGKNHYGMQDKTEYVVTPNVQQENDYNEDDIRKRYLTDSADSNS